jgi:D-arabinose 5-phosphate isomerase GutQ
MTAFFEAVFQSTSPSSSLGAGIVWSGETQTADNASPYVQSTVNKIIAAKKGKDAHAPKDADEFLDWLNR